MVRAVFSSGTGQLTVAVAGCWYNDGDKGGVGREGAGRRKKDWMRCWERESECIRTRGEKRLCRILWRAVADEKHVTSDLTAPARDEPRRACLDKTTPPSPNLLVSTTSD